MSLRKLMRDITKEGDESVPLIFQLLSLSLPILFSLYSLRKQTRVHFTFQTFLDQTWKKDE